MDGDIARGTWGRASWRPLGDHQVWWCCPERPSGAVTKGWPPSWKVPSSLVLCSQWKDGGTGGIVSIASSAASLARFWWD